MMGRPDVTMILPPPPDAFRWEFVSAGPALVCLPLAETARHLFTTRAWPLGSAGAAERQWDETARAFGVEALARVRQVHGHTAVVARAGERATRDADIIITSDSSVTIAVQAADCVPLLMADRATGAVAAAHAGWRGMAARVPHHAVQALAREFGSRPSDLIAAAGPSIGACCYEVRDDVRARFAEAGFSAGEIDRWFADGRPEHWMFDGWRCVRDQLIAAGLLPTRIHQAALCTACAPDLLPSYRRDGSAAGRIAALIRPRP